MRRKSSIIATIFLTLFFFIPLHAKASFKVIVLGSEGGPFENNLSGYLFAPIESDMFVSLDAGSLLHGIYKAYLRNSFQNFNPDPGTYLSNVGTIFQQHVKAYLISHAHLDHVAGLVINSTADTPKTIYALDTPIDYIRDYLFNWRIWPNFGSEGIVPILNKYQYHRLSIGEKEAIPGTSMSVTAYPLSHPNGYLSTAFLIESSGSFVIYFGDTSPDSLEPKKHIRHVWEKAVPLI